jgi:NCS2 family nucleobase:cation symporter-2
MSSSDDSPRVVYGVDERPPLREALPLGVQHVVAMLSGNVTPPLLIAGGLALGLADTSLLIQMCLLMAGLATLVQSYPIGPVGGRIPVIMGTSIAFVAAIVAVGREYGLAAAFGACLVAALVEVVIGFNIVRLRALFPPLVNGVVVMLIGLTLVPVGMDYAAGGVGADDYGAPAHLGVALLVLATTVLVSRLARGFLSYAAMLVGMSVGYLVSLALGRVDLSPVASSAWLSLPRPLAFGIEFQWTPIVILAVIYIISAMETIGDITGTLAAVGREPSDRELRGGLVADGVMSGIASLFSAFPNTSFSQNVGLVHFTGVVSRHVTAVGGAVLLLLGLSPKVGSLFATIPRPVIGGAGLLMFAMIFVSGLGIVHRGVELDRRNMVILATAIGLGLAVELRPDALRALAPALRTLLGSGLIVGGLSAALMNLVLPRR